ncbi:HNH endonuclease [Ornithinimicrobium sp. LYQ103]|uniref:HNH endonuclease n=1 Tax=Ornithinimicrobium sp. LYQ103 TaxID=3378796 RepID=UPI0038520F0A
MASWVLSISEDFPQHWGYAVEHGTWDLRKHRDIRGRDLIYFWQSGSKGGWLGRAVAAEDAYLIDTAHVPPGPWDDWPGNPPYQSRFAMNVLDSAPAKKVSWGKVRKDLGTNINPGWIYPFTTAQEKVLASYFASSVVESILEQLVQEDDTTTDDVARLDLSVLSEDQRTMVEQFVAIREGQSGFRKALLDVYPGCAITGTAVLATLDAAHISPYSGLQSNDPRNGLILRKDVHRLFDMHMLTIDETNAIRVAPQLTDTTYGELDGQMAALPTDDKSRPDPAVLAAHRAKCAWLPALEGTPPGVG